MLRHSKAQADCSGEGIVALPPKREEVVLVPLADASERVVYGEVEALCRRELARTLRTGTLQPRHLQKLATHPSSLSLELLDQTIAAADRAAAAARGSGRGLDKARGCCYAML